MLSNSCAIYARYSSLDKITINNCSRSIENQINILSDFALNQGFNIFKIYADYNYSGSNFSRPEIINLLDDCSSHKFSIILIKDLSRFGRNYLEVGNYINNVFVKNGIRLISYDDNIDSFKKNDFLVLAIKNFLNDYYLKDISKKIKKSLYLKAQKEALCTRKYGYKKVNNKFIIDEYASKIVRLIFKMKIQKISNKNIILYLFNHKVLKPSIYYQNTYKFKNIIDNKSNYIWSNKTINFLLQDPFYLGKCINYKGVNNMDKIIINNNHPSLITKEEFDKVNLHKKKKKKLKDIIKKEIICLNCNTSLKLKSDNNIPIYKCKCNKYLVANLNTLIYQAFIKKVNDLINNKIKYINNIMFFMKEKEKNYNALLVKQNKLINKLQSIFESYVNKTISKEAYKPEIETLNNELKEIKIKLSNNNYYSKKEVETKINNFIDTYIKYKDTHLNKINEFVYQIQHDVILNKVYIILNLEHELNINFNSDYNLSSKDIIIKILRLNNSLKIKDIYQKAKVEGDYTYNCIKKTIYRLLKEKIIIKETASIKKSKYKLINKNLFN